MLAVSYVVAVLVILTFLAIGMIIAWSIIPAIFREPVAGSARSMIAAGVAGPGAVASFVAVLVVGVACSTFVTAGSAGGGRQWCAGGGCRGHDVACRHGVAPALVALTSAQPAPHAASTARRCSFGCRNLEGDVACTGGTGVAWEHKTAGEGEQHEVGERA